MTGKKKAHRNAPAFQALFSQHGAKRLAFKRCLLAFLWAQVAFLLQAFSFLNKKKIRNAESIKVLIIVGRESRRHIFIVPLSRHRCVEVAAPYNAWERVPSIFASFVGR